MEVAKVKHHVTMPETGQPREHHVPVRPGSGSVSSRPSLKLLVPDPDSEYELDSESVRCAPGGGVKGDGVEESSVDSGRGSRGSTPPVQEEDDNENREEEIARKHVSPGHIQRLNNYQVKGAIARVVRDVPVLENSMFPLSLTTARVTQNTAPSVLARPRAYV